MQGVVVVASEMVGVGDIEVVERSERGGGRKRDSVDRGCGWGSSRLASLVGVGDYEMAE